MKFLDKLIEKNKDKFKTTTMFGTPISELNSDELRACVCVLGEEIEQARKNSKTERDMYRTFLEARG